MTGFAHAEPELPLATPAPLVQAAEDVVPEVTGSDMAAAYATALGEDVVDQTQALVQTAMSMIGIRYRFGGTSAATGFDCSGFVRAMYQQTMGHLLPRSAREQAQATQVIDKHALQPGDLVFFNTRRARFSHVGIYLGDGKFIHAPSKGKKVQIERMDQNYWAKRFNGARRVQVAGTSSLKLSASQPGLH